MEKEGKPMSNDDLISREALKNEFRKDVMGGLNWERIIDNAPTVEPTFGLFRAMICESCQAYATNRAIAKLADEYTNPRGKWIFKHNSSDIWCSVCDENFDEIPQKFNYCPNCGADMREEGTK